MKKKIVLFSGSASSSGKRINLAPLSLLHISSFLVKDGFEVKIFSGSTAVKDAAEIMTQCRDSICLGISAMTGGQIFEGLQISSMVKEKYPEVPIIWGGWHPSILPESTLQDSNVDIVVEGQGERKFYELVKLLYDSDRKKLNTIPGVSFKENGQAALNRELKIESMDNFPPVPYHLTNIKDCITITEYGTSTLQYISSYGCPCRCSFCIEPAVNKQRWVSLSAERVVDDWEYLSRKYNLDSIAVYDSNFFVNKKRVVEICELILKKNLNLKWGNANGRIPQLVKFEKEIWKLMQLSGLKMILTGSESGDQEVLDLINKDAKVEDIYKFTELCAEHEIKILFSYMSGIPWSKDLKYNQERVQKEINNILTQVDTLLKISNKNRFMIYTYTPLPGSTMYDMARKNGFIEPRTLKEWSELVYSPEDIFKKTDCLHKWISGKQLQLISMLEQYVFGMMDIDAKSYIAGNINNKFLRYIFLISFNIGYLLARFRLKTKNFTLPVDYWLFIKVRKALGM